MTLAAVFGVAGLLALGKKLIDFAKMATNWRTQKTGAVTQLVAWAVFTVLVFLFGAAQTGSRIELVSGLSWADLNWGAKLILGLMLGSGGGLVTDWLQARDNHDSQALPPLNLPGLGRAAPHPAEPWQAEPDGPIGTATVAVQPVLDPAAIDALRSEMDDAVRPVIDAAFADLLERIKRVPAGPPSAAVAEPESAEPA